MLSKSNGTNRDQLEMVSLDEMVPEDHLVRKLEKAIDFSFIYDLVEDLYSDRGRPGIEPVVLLKIPFLQYTFGIRSMRRTIEESTPTWRTDGSSASASMIRCLIFRLSERTTNDASRTLICSNKSFTAS